MISQLLAIIIAASVIGIIHGLSRKIPLLKTWYVYIIVYVIIALWTLSFILLLVLGGMSVSDALYWIVVSTFGAEPLRNPPENIVVQNTLLIDAVSSFILLALIVTLVVESFTRKAMEAYEKDLTGVENRVDYSNHIVIIGWTKASHSAYKELRELEGDKTKIVVVDRPENIARVKRELREESPEGVGGDPCSDEALERASIWRARSIIISLGDDSRSALALLHVKQVINKHREELDRENRRINVVVEVLRDENAPLIQGIGGDKYLNTVVVVSRSLVGKLFASAVMEPSVLAFMCDSTSATYGVTAFDEVEAREIIGENPVRLGDIQLKLLGNLSRNERKLILAVIKHGRDEIFIPRRGELLNTVIDPNDRLIVLRYEEEKKEKGDIPLDRELGFKLDIYEWVRNGSFQKLWEIERERGHISVIGWSEATESFIEELTGIRRRLGEIVDGELSHGYTIDKTLILLSDKKFREVGLEDVVVVYGQYTLLSSLRRAGVSTADIIIISVDGDDKTTHILLHINELFTEKGKRSRPVVIVETELDRTAELLLDDRLADVAIASRSFAGRVLAYAARDPTIYRFLSDVATGVSGRFDLREIDVNALLKRLGKEEASFKEIFEYLTMTLNMIPVAIVTEYEGGKAIIYIPKLERMVKEGDKIVALTYL